MGFIRSRVLGSRGLHRGSGFRVQGFRGLGLRAVFGL